VLQIVFRRVAVVEIRRQQREAAFVKGGRQTAQKGVRTEVELVISHGHRVDAQCVKHLQFRLQHGGHAQVEDRVADERIAGVKDQSVRIDQSFGHDDGGGARDAAYSAAAFRIARRTGRQVGMRVVEMQDREVLRDGLRGRHSQGHHEHECHEEVYRSNHNSSFVVQDDACREWTP